MSHSRQEMIYTGIFQYLNAELYGSRLGCGRLKTHALLVARAIKRPAASLLLVTFIQRSMGKMSTCVLDAASAGCARAALLTRQYQLVLMQVRRAGQCWSVRTPQGGSLAQLRRAYRIRWGFGGEGSSIDRQPDPQTAPYSTRMLLPCFTSTELYGIAPGRRYGLHRSEVLHIAPPP